MSLLETYCITHNSKGEFVVDFTTNQNVNVSYSMERDGTQIINVAPDAKGGTSFSKNFGNLTAFNFAFDQQDPMEKGGREPSGGINNGG